MGLLSPDMPVAQPSGLLGYTPPTTPTGAQYGNSGPSPSGLLNVIWEGIKGGLSPQGFTNMAKIGLQQQSNFLQGNDPNTGQPAVSPYDRMNTLAHFVSGNIGPQAVGGTLAPAGGVLGAGPIRAIMGDKLPAKGLAPANLASDGTLYVGRSGGMHFEIAEKYPASSNREYVNLGFVTPSGDFLNREEALKWANSNGKSIRPSEVMGNSLDALDYREQR